MKQLHHQYKLSNQKTMRRKQQQDRERGQERRQKQGRELFYIYSGHCCRCCCFGVLGKDLNEQWIVVVNSKSNSTQGTAFA